MKTPLSVPGAPAAVGPYSQAQVVRLHGGNRMVFTAGQIALDPSTGELNGGDIGAQTEQVVRNLAAILAGAGLSLADVVKTTVFLADMNDFQAMNRVYEEHFKATPPARTTVAVAGLPRGARVEIEAVAVGRDY
jgi:2-iminobutanoate/2-iminopropanoate deaminase